MSFELTPEQLSQAKAILAVFQEKFPEAFFSEPERIRPLKIDIHHDLYAVFAEQYAKKAINRALKLYTRNSDYFNALTLGNQRVDLEGKPAGEVSQAHIEIAEDAKSRQQRRKAREETRKKQLEEQQEATQPQTTSDSEVESVESLAQEKAKPTGRAKLGLKKKEKPNTLLKMRVEKTVKEKQTLKLSTKAGEQPAKRRVSTQAGRISKKQLEQRKKEKELSQLPFGKMEIRLKIQSLPDEIKTVKHGWQQFTVQEDRYFVRVTVRPRTWKKLQEAATHYSYWVANITGKMGPRLKGDGFELLEPVTQIFERKPDPEELAEVSAASEQDAI
jgi:sRNA-binding protein